jgi:hypothetical protein
MTDYFRDAVLNKAKPLLRRCRPALLLALSLGALAGCHDTAPAPPPAPTTGHLRLTFNHVTDAGGSPLVLGQPYTTAVDDPVQIDHLRYYVSNVRLTKTDSSVWPLPTAYFLIDATRRDTLTLRGVPFGQYVKLTFDIGVDSAANARGDHTGDLDPARGMYWTWLTGYKFLSLDGRWLGDTALKVIEYHIGRAPMLRTIGLRLPQPATVTVSATPHAQLAVQALAVFGGPHLMNLRDDQDRTIMFDTQYAQRVADNYATMFGVTRVE